MIKKKILFVITKSEMGGAQRFLYELTTHLDKETYEILIAAGLSAGGELLEKMRTKNIETVRIKNFSNRFGLKNFLAFWEIFNLIGKVRPDVLYLLSSEAGFTGSIAGALRRLLSQRKMKIIYRIGGWAFKEPRNILIKKIYLWAEKISAPFKDVIITNSEFDRRLAIKNKIAKPEKIITIHNGLDFDSLKFFPREQAKKFILSKINRPQFEIANRVLIGTVANLYKNKGLNILISATEEIKICSQKTSLSPILVIIGEGEERRNLENAIKKSKLENDIFLTGAITDACQYLKAFDIFVLPSVKEGQPWTILEAMAAETPIVASNIAGIPEMIENEKSGLLVEPADPVALAAAIRKLLTHPSLSQECAKNAFSAVKAKFGLDNMIRKNKDLL